MKSRIPVCLAAAFLTVAAFAPAAPAAEAAKFDLKLVTEGLVSPTSLVSLPGDSGALLVTDQPGTIHLLSKEGQLSENLFLDLRPRMAKLNEGFDERGLLGLALHPKFKENKKFYVVYSGPLRGEAPKEWNHTMILSEFTAAADGQTAKLDSEKVILEIDQPYFNHNGGAPVFGPDGYLYLSVGDGGNANDIDAANKPLGRPPEGNGQNLDTLLGKILRIDVDKGQPYAIPRDNPFAGKKGRPEIFAYGFRNPWRISFDRGGQHDLFAADVGQEMFEEVNIVQNGGNYGWRIREGFGCFDPKTPKNPPADCPKQGANGEPLVDPIIAYKNLRGFPRDPDGMGISITGGFVYRGKALPQWQGKYIFADWSRAWVKPAGVLFAGSKEGSKWTSQSIKPASDAEGDGLNFYICAFGEDADGELYVLTNDTNGLTGKGGKVFKIVPL